MGYKRAHTHAPAPAALPAHEVHATKNLIRCARLSEALELPFKLAQVGDEGVHDLTERIVPGRARQRDGSMRRDTTGGGLTHKVSSQMLILKQETLAAELEASISCSLWENTKSRCSSAMNSHLCKRQKT